MVPRPEWLEWAEHTVAHRSMVQAPSVYPSDSKSGRTRDRKPLKLYRSTAYQLVLAIVVCVYHKMGRARPLTAGFAQGLNAFANLIVLTGRQESGEPLWGNSERVHGNTEAALNEPSLSRWVGDSGRRSLLALLKPGSVFTYHSLGRTSE